MRFYQEAFYEGGLVENGDPFDNRHTGEDPLNPDTMQEKYPARPNQDERAEPVTPLDGVNLHNTMDWADVGEMMGLEDFWTNTAGVMEEVLPQDTPLVHDAEGRPFAFRMFRGLPVVVENQPGSVRYWTDEDGCTGETKMKYDYGYFIGTEGADDEPVDVYLGPNEDSEWVYVIHQLQKPDFILHDEDKCMLGFDSEESAKEAYFEHMSDERFYGGMSAIPFEAFKQKVQSGGSDKITTE